ncbi:hypothetical protein CABS01_11642 [Colletotrichum abscissum]|nr:hypothetical protein CABS01_11642 [Colletotrichum abscissum]
MTCTRRCAIACGSVIESIPHTYQG